MAPPDEQRADLEELERTATAAGRISASSDNLAPGTMLGSYRLGKCRGRGAMGAVYEGTHETLGRRAAIKVLLSASASAETALPRFLREGQAAARVRHPNVVDIYDVGAERGIAFLVMELLDGEDLSGLLARETRLTPRHAADILLPVLKALAAAHDSGVIHRDLKPSNIFLARERGDVITPKVLDFGISKLLDDEKAQALTATSSFLGTPFYMSPEQVASAKHLDARTDLYSVAVILYEALSGCRPFEGDSILALLTKIHAGQHQPLSSVAPDVPRSLAEIVERGMSREAARRFPSADEFAAALMPFASDRVRAVLSPERGAEPAPAERVLGEAVTLRAIPGDRQDAMPDGLLAKGASSTDAVVEDVHPVSRKRRMRRPVLAIVATLGLVSVALASNWAWGAWNEAKDRAELQSRWANLALPMSDAADSIPPSVIRFALTRRELLVEGDPNAVAIRPLDSASPGFAEPFVREDSGGMLIPSVVAAATEAKARLTPHATVAPPVLLEIDERTPYLMVVQTGYSLAQAGFRTYLFEVETPQGKRCLPNFAPGNDPDPAPSSSKGPPRAGGTLGPVTVELEPITLFITADGVSVKVDGGNLAPGCAGIGPGVTVPALGADGERQPILDYPALKACAQRIKESDPHHVRGFRVAAKNDLQYRVLVGVIGAVRKTSDGRPLLHDFSLAVAR